MGRTICLHYEQVCNYIDNDPHLEDWWDYCHKYHCQISEENELNCDTCKDYESGMHIACECIHYNQCALSSYYNPNTSCTDLMARECSKYQEE